MRHWHNKEIIIFLVATSILYCCTEQETKPIFDIRDYYPLHIGDVAVFNCLLKEVRYDMGGNITFDTTITYKERHQTESFFITQGDTVFVEVISRSYDGEPFTNADMWSIRRNYRTMPSELIIQEGNISYVRLASPEDAIWNLNKYNNNLPPHSGSAYEDICVISRINNTMVRVIEQDSENPITDQRSSTYQLNVGLVERKSYFEKYETEEVTDTNGKKTEIVYRSTLKAFTMMKE